MKNMQNIVTLALMMALVGTTALWAGGSREDDGYIIGVVTGTTFEEEARGFDNVRDIMLYEDDNQTLSELANQRVDAVITDRIVGINAISKGNFGSLELAGDLLYQEIIGVAFHKDDNALRQAVNEALEEVIADGTYAAISEHYFGDDILAGLDRPVTFSDEEPATDDSLEKAEERGYVSFAMSGGYPPFNYYDEKNELTGFDVETARAVVERLGLEYRPVTTAWDGIIEGLRAQRYDGIWGSMAITEARLRIVDFSNPYYISGAQLIVRQGSPITGPETFKSQ